MAPFQTCPNCRAEVNSQARFCPQCGTALGGTKTCPYCRAEIAATAQFCSACGQPVGNVRRTPDVSGNVWRAGPDELAVRLEPADLEGRAYREIEVQPGQQIVLLADGKASGQAQGEGRYTLRSLGDWIAALGRGRHVTALLVRGDPLRLEFEVADLYTADDYRLSGRCVLSATVGDPSSFFRNVMRTRQSCAVTDLRAYLFDQVRDAVRDVAGRHKLADLVAGGPALREQLATALEVHLGQTLRDSGLRIEQVTIADFVHERYDARRQRWEAVRLTLDEKRDDLEQRRLLDELEAEAADQETARLRAQARIFEERAQVRQAVQQAVNSDRMNEVRSGEELAIFLREVDKNRLIRDDEWERLQREFAERREDQALARAHTLALLKLEQEYDERMARALREHRLTLEGLAQQRAEEEYRQQTQMRLEEARALWEIRLRQQQAEARRAEEAAEAAARRERETQDRLAQLDLQLRSARTAAEIEAIEREQDRLDIELGLQTLEKMKAIRRRDEEERRLAELRAQREQVEIELLAEQRRLEMQLQAERERRRFELERIETLGRLSAEALIAVSGAEQAALLADLKRTEALRGMTEEQILALAAEKSPEVARAFGEKFRALAEGRMSEREQALYERLVAEQKEIAQLQRQMAEEQARRQQELAAEALRTQADVAKAFAQARPPAGSTVVFPPGGVSVGYPTVVGEGGVSGEVQVCPRCRVRMPVGAKFCTNCGHKFFE